MKYASATSVSDLTRDAWRIVAKRTTGRAGRDAWRFMVEREPFETGRDAGRFVSAYLREGDGAVLLGRVAG